MSDTCGIIAEFNPFHNGHRALIQAARDAGAKTVVCVMSGNFVQRGSVAVTDKRVRAKAALECGADLIFELPLAHSVATAQRFARGAIYLLNAAGCVDMLAFGSECGDVSGLTTLSKVIDEPEVTHVMRAMLKEGLTFARARERAVAKVYGEELASRLSGPNNILGIEYLRESALQGLRAEPFTIKRLGVAHHDQTANNGFASASFLRANADNHEELSANVPPKAAALYVAARERGLFPADPGKLDIAILSYLRRLRTDELSVLPDLSEGLENRLFATVRTATSLEGLCEALKTKRYTMTRVRRLVLCAFLGIAASDCNAAPPYLRVLGFTENGRKLLPSIKKLRRLPLDTSLAVLRARGGLCGRFASLEEISTDLYNLCLPTPLPCGYEYTETGIFPN